MKWKNKTLFSRFLALIVAFVMIVTLASVTASAAGGNEGGGDDSGDGVFTNKTVTLEDDGTYTINLEAYATGTVSGGESEPCDIVLILDQSGSMGDNQFESGASYQKLPSSASNSTAWNYRNNLYYQNENGEYVKVTVTREWHRTGIIRGYYVYQYSAEGFSTATSDYEDGSIPSPYRGNLYYYGSTSSMTRMEALEEAATNFLEEIAAASAEGVDYRVAIVGFASNGDRGYNNTELLSTSWTVNYGDANSNNYKDALVSAIGTNGQVNSRLTNAIDRLDASGDTYSEYGIDMANKIFENNPTTDGRNRAIVVFTDGYPAPYDTDDFKYSMANNAIANAYTSKNTYGASVYTVGIFDESDPTADINSNFAQNDGWSDRWNSNNLTAAQEQTAANRYMHYMSSNYPQAQSLQNGGNGSTNDGYYMSAHDTESLNEIFKQISDSISGTTVTLDANSEMRDILNTGFILPEGYDAESKIIAYTSDYEGNGDWADPVEFTDAHITAADGVITISNFSYKDHYVVEETTEDKPDLGQKLMVTITGVIPTDEAVTNAAVNTNAAASGIYADGDSSTPSATFPQPQTILTSKAYVLDYAKETSLSGFDQSVEAIVDNMRAVTGSENSVIGTYGNSSLSGSSISYVPKTTNWDGYDNVYMFGKTDNSDITSVEANKNGYLWSRVSVIPANNVYYEDDFITDEKSGTVGIEYDGTWTIDGDTSGNEETANSGTHGGWENVDLANDQTYSDGSAHQAVASDENAASAKFTFTGTGVDIYSRTNMETGTVVAMLTGETDEGARVAKAFAVDNKAASGDYYQIPTVSFSGLEHGTYTVTITVTTAAASEERYTYYLDGIRVYNPIQDLEEDETVSGAYGESELKAVFSDVRDLITNSYLAFIDEGTENNVGDYNASDIGKLAPENEIYLATDQKLVIKVATDKNNTYYLGLKAPEGTARAEVTNGNQRSELPEINHSTDLYYQVTPDANGCIVVENTGDNLLSVTKLRTTGSEENGVLAISNEEAATAVVNFMAADYASYVSEPEQEDEMEEQIPSETPEIETPEMEEQGDVTIENPEDYENPNAEEEREQIESKPSIGENWISNLFSSIKNLFARW